MSISEPALEDATIVPDERRQNFLPALFGRPLLMVAENTVYSSDEFDELIERHKSLRKFGKLVFHTFSFRSLRPDDPVLRAVEHLRALYNGRKLPAQEAIAFMTRKWRRRVRSDGITIDLKAWEVARLLRRLLRPCAGNHAGKRSTFLPTTSMNDAGLQAEYRHFAEGRNSDARI